MPEFAELPELLVRAGHENHPSRLYSKYYGFYDWRTSQLYINNERGDQVPINGIGFPSKIETGYFFVPEGFNAFVYDSIEISDDAGLIIEGNIFQIGDVNSNFSIGIPKIIDGIHVKIEDNFSFETDSLIVREDSSLIILGDNASLIVFENPSFQILYSIADVSNPPSKAEIISSFGDPSEFENGQVGLINDNNATANIWLCTVVNGEWCYNSMTKSV